MLSYDLVLVRTDGFNPNWSVYYQYSGPPLISSSSGFRGLTCVPNPNGQGTMLIAGIESSAAAIYAIPLDGSNPTIELNTSNFLASQLGTWIGYGIPAYNSMALDPQASTPGCPTYLIGLGLVSAAEYKGYIPSPLYLIRHCNGTYGYRNIDDTSISRYSLRSDSNSELKCILNFLAILEELSIQEDMTLTESQHTIQIGSIGGPQMTNPPAGRREQRVSDGLCYDPAAEPSRKRR